MYIYKFSRCTKDNNLHTGKFKSKERVSMQKNPLHIFEI